jgi:serine/threonine-protein kinase
VVLEHNDVSLKVGEEFAGHRIEREIGRGGMGVVYLAEHLRLERKVAIKVLNPDFARDDVFLRRFIRESRLAAELYHENIVQVFDAGEVDGVAYISMRFVEGTDLAALLRSDGTLTHRETVAIARQVGSALDFAHERGLVHRDVKPANILLESARADGERRAFLSDFGVTKRVSGDGMTASGQFVGTIDYTAPEQIRGADLDGRTDQYSLACVLFQCLVGGVPFPRDADVPKMFAHVQDPPPSIAERGLAAGPAVDEVIRRAMAKRPTDRFDTCVEFVDAAADALDVPRTPGASVTRMETRPPITAPMPAPPGDGGRPHRSRRVRRTVVALLMTLVLLAGTAGAILLARGDGHETDGSPSAGPSQSAGPATKVSALASPPGSFPASFTWTRSDSDLFGGPGQQIINRATATRDRVVAVGYKSLKGNDDPEVWLYNAITDKWLRLEIDEGSGPGKQSMAAVIPFRGRFIAVGSVDEPDRTGKDAAVWRSNEDGTAWKLLDTPVAFGAPGDQQIQRIVREGDTLIAVGFDTQLSTGKDASAWTSTDGAHWEHPTPDNLPQPGSQAMWNAVEFGGQLVAVGFDDSDAAVWQGSPFDWTRTGIDDLSTPGMQVMKAVVPAGPGLVAVGGERGVQTEREDAAAWTSVDGSTWVPRPDSGFLLPKSQEMIAAFPLNGGVVAVGRGGVWTSPDGADWSWAYDGDPLPGEEIVMRGVVMVGDRLIVVGHTILNGEVDAAVWVGTPTFAASPTPSSSSATGASSGGP